MGRDTSGIVDAVADWMRNRVSRSEGSHDWLHTERVWKLSLNIAEKEASPDECDMLIVELSALLHDVADAKYHDNDETIGPRTARAYLETFEAQHPGTITRSQIDAICTIIATMSYRHRLKAINENAKMHGTEREAALPQNAGAGWADREKDLPPSLEFAAVHDADRLDAMGAIGIARCFAYGGSRGRALYDSSTIDLDLADTRIPDKETYVTSGSASLTHFYEKLFHLKDLMLTETGRKMAIARDAFMHDFVDRFRSEVNGDVS